jgi:hypothetical protein
MNHPSATAARRRLAGASLLARVPAGLLLAALLLVAGVGCTGLPGLPTAAPSPPSPAATPTGLVVVVLSADQPSARIAQPRQPAVTGVRLAVQAIQNPSGQGVALRVAVEDTATPPRHVDVGAVSPYPSNQPGVFTLVLPEAAAAMVHEGPTVLIVTLTPLSSAVLQAGISFSLRMWLLQL